jgi:hypothetical protein
MKRIFTILLLSSLGCLHLQAQTISDGFLMPKKTLCTGFLYTHDQWTKYWEGTLNRKNGNIGTITTQSLMWMGTYGITDKLNVIAMLPYVKTKASMGTLHSMEGIQDITVALKYNFFALKTEKYNLRFFGVGAFSTPLTDYTPDFLPLSLGLASTTGSARLTGYFALSQGWFINASGAYTLRSNVTLDRPSYYDDGKLYNTDEVKMPNVFDYSVSIGYRAHGLQAQLDFMRQNTLGGVDIRRQDMPFVSNRMNYSKGGALVMYYLPQPRGLAVRGSVMYTLDGRNVGQSTTLMGGLLYTFIFKKNETTTDVYEN